MIVEKDFGAIQSQDVQDRHGFAAQGPRRKLMGKARNYLLSAAMKPEHSWVYWRDVDIVANPASIIEDFVAHDRDVLVPSRSTCISCFRQTNMTDAIFRCLVPQVQGSEWPDAGYRGTM